MLRAAAIAERAGIPSVSLVTTPFLAQASVVARGVGMPDLPIAEYPGVPMTDGPEAVRAKVEALVPRIVEGLARPVTTTAHATAEPGPRDVVFRGTLDEVQEFLHENLWSDGLPVIPPTRERVERFLAHTKRDPEQILGRLLPENRAATVWSVAVNGVMAGCRAEYMPVLVAIVEAIAQPEFRVQDAGSTPGWEPLVIVSGPIARALDLNHGQGVMRVGRQANTSLGRFLRLYLRNVAGLRIPPGAGDKGSIAGSFHVALAEDEDAAAAMGWPTFGEDRGFARTDSIVTVQSVVSVSPPIYTAGTRARDHVDVIAEVFGAECAYWSFTGMKYGRWQPLLVLGPSIAKVIAADGWTKDDLRRHLHEHATMAARDVERHAYHLGTTTFSLARQVKDGILPAAYAASDDPERRVPVFVQPEAIGILVAGDPGRNQSRGYCNNHIQGGRVSRRVDP
ncbi:MAG TPA: hypothetical protein VNN07_09240 [Candidatus Tectomicrobia bacterium]|nr:hypothetical protein [Candidatus Tectomicrobia bacterium]